MVHRGLTVPKRPDTTQSYQADLAAIQQFAPAYKEQVYAVTVGSETMYRKNFTGAQLATMMQQTKSALNGMFKIGTADTWNVYADGTADAVIQSKPDLLCALSESPWGRPR
jgi:glucan 1,3-beta-glucosidase